MQISDKELKKQILDEVSKILQDNLKELIIPGMPIRPGRKPAEPTKDVAMDTGDTVKDPSAAEKAARHAAEKAAEIEKLAAEDPEKAFNEYKSANSTVQAIIFPFLLRPNVIPLIVLTKQIESASKNPEVKTFLRKMSEALEEHFKKAVELSYDEKFQTAGTKIPAAPEPQYTQYGIEEKKTK